MTDIQIGDIHIQPGSKEIELRDPSKGTKIIIPVDALSSVVEFLTFYAESDAAERRRSYRITIEPADTLLTWIGTPSGKTVEADPVDLSLGGMLVKVDDPGELELSSGADCLVRLELDANAADLNSKIVRVIGDRLALSFIDCEAEGELVPTVEVMRIYSELQRRWLSRRVVVGT